MLALPAPTQERTVSTVQATGGDVASGASAVPTEHANTRLEAFCDGVFAIAVTLLVIDIRAPAAESLASTADVSRALAHLAPQVFAFLLSFVVIFITWVNHHATLKLVSKSSPAFVYANGLLLLTVAFIPFPTSLLGELIGTDRAAPAVVLYDAVLAAQGLPWVLLCNAALAQGLTANPSAAAQLRRNLINGYGAMAFYALLALAAVWLPVAAAVITAASWVFWLVLGISLRRG
jgi:uncharacterized membrane protein